MSGNAENPGCESNVHINIFKHAYAFLDANNPSDLLKEFHAEKKEKNMKKANDDSSESDGEYEEVKHAPVDQVQLLADIRDEHGFNFKTNILHNIRSDDVLKVKFFFV